MSAHASPRRVVVYGLGGTIAMTSDSGRGVVPALSAAQLVEAVPGWAEAGIEVEVVDFRRLPSASLGFDDLLALAAEIRGRLARGGVDGVVVTQGTDTLEEAAYLLDLFHTAAEPVVVTGAMRNPALAGADGPANLLAAVRTAAHPASRGRGVLVVLADQIHAASRVRKTHTSGVGAFTSPDSGPLGLVTEGDPWFLSGPTVRFTLDPAAVRTRPRVPLVTVAFGDDGVLLHGLAGRADGLVVAGAGGGHVPRDLVAPLEELAGSMPVVLASRTGAGPVLRATYAYPGSERDLLERGLVGAGLLDPLKARVLLWALLACGGDRDAVVSAFGRAGGAVHG